MVIVLNDRFSPLLHAHSFSHSLSPSYAVIPLKIYQSPFIHPLHPLFSSSTQKSSPKRHKICVSHLIEAFAIHLSVFLSVIVCLCISFCLSVLFVCLCFSFVVFRLSSISLVFLIIFHLLSFCHFFHIHSLFCAVTLFPYVSQFCLYISLMPFC